MIYITRPLNSICEVRNSNIFIFEKCENHYFLKNYFNLFYESNVLFALPGRGKR